MRKFKQHLVRIGIGTLITLWISALVIWNSGFLLMFNLNKIVATIVLVGVMVFLASQLIPAYVRWHQQIDQSDKNKSRTHDEKVALTISYLRARARRLRHVAIYALTLNVLLIFSGIYLLKGEESLSMFLNPMHQARYLFENKYSLLEAIDFDERRLATLKQENQLGGVQDAETGHFQNLPSIEMPLIPPEANTHEGELTSCGDQCRATRIKVNKARLADIDRRNEALLAIPKDARVISEPIITSAVTKVISAVLLLILVQILISLYRYSTRLAAFYDSRADMLFLIDTPNIDAHTLIAILMPDLLGFEKVRVGMLSELLETINKVIPFAEQRGSA